MRRLGLLLALLFFAVPAMATIAIDVHTSVDNGSTSSNQVVLTFSPASAHDLITCQFSFSGLTTFTSLSDSVDGNYTVAVAAHKNTVIDQVMGIYYLQNASTSGSRTVTLTIGAAHQFSAMSCQSWTGVAQTGNILDQTGQADCDSGNSAACPGASAANPNIGGNLTPVGANELVIAAVQMNANTPTAGTNYTLIDSNTTTLWFTEDWVQTTATATNGPFVASADSWTDQVAIFSPTAITSAFKTQVGAFMVGP